jgi:hypothetical protein
MGPQEKLSPSQQLNILIDPPSFKLYIVRWRIERMHFFAS